MEDLEGILRTLSEHRGALEQRGARRLAVFGSFARGEAGPDSDLDMLVELDQRTFDRFMDVKIYLEDLFGRRVDLVLADRIKPRLKDRILAEAIDAS